MPRPASPSPSEPHAASPAQQASELRRRSQWGGLFYAFAWAVIAGFADAFDAYPVSASLMLLAFFALAVARMRFPEAPADDAAAVPYLRRLWRLLLCGAALLGLASSWALLDPVFAGVEMVVLLCVISLGTAFAQVFGEARRCAYLGTAMISLPSLAIEALDGQSWGVVVTLAFHYVYLVGLIQQVHRDSLERLGLEHALRVERDRFEAQSRTDPLTGLANRRSFGFAMQRWQSEASPDRDPAWLLMLDLDHFKRVNDEHGHPAGDAALVHVAAVLQARLTGSEHLLARLGGEEFGVLFRAADVEAALGQADDLRAALRAQPLRLEQGELVALQASGGLAPLGADEATAYAAADAALYRAKAGGRNQVVAAGPATAP